MRFPKKFFEGEEREGFYVEQMMKRAWASQIEILSEIDLVCKKYGIKYFAFWGSLLGTVRHAGFVPWDDDLDIIMLREDYDKFFEVAQGELPEDYKVISIYSEPEWCVGVGRVTNGNGIILMPDKLSKYHGCPYSMGIDIFPYDYIPDNEEALKEQMEILEFIKNAKEEVLDDIIYDGENEKFIITKSIDCKLKELEQTFGFQFNREVHLVNQLCCLYDQVYVMYGDTNSKYVTCYEEKLKRQANGKDFKLPAYWLKDVTYLPFEGFEIPVPKYYEACLSVCYGQKFMIPIKAGISGHDYPIYKDQNAFMEERKLTGLYEKSMKFYIEEYSGNEYVEPLKIFLKQDIVGTENSNTLESETYEKKCFLYCVSCVDVYGYEEAFVNKVCNTLEKLMSLLDQETLIFSYDPLVLDLLADYNCKLSEKLLSAVKQYEDNGYQVTDYSEVPYIINRVKGYYGSCGENTKRCTLNKVPVMIQNLSINE